ncbi:alanyl-tRNA synthetase [Escherichia coli]|uniref:Alanyl-tRNA synthetase n=1 Tax=Escherichia coli TaxID=562 RepID=A0A377C3Y3_ECOLX|nr:alanyl-tRNA synthetase [Escherichia coli]
MLGAKETFFYKLVGPLIDVMGSAGEDLKRQQAQVEQVLKTEEEQFARTLERGLALLDEELANFLVIRWMVKRLSVCTTPMASRLT